MRGYALSGQKAFLAPYTNGMADERNAIRALQAVSKQLPIRRRRPEERGHAGPLLADALRAADHPSGRPGRKARGQP